MTAGSCSNFRSWGLPESSSPLPVYFSDYIVRHEAEAAALLDFLTIFNNRMYALFYRAWKKYRLILSSAGDPLVRCIAALAGIPLNMDLPASALRSLAYAGLNAGAPRSHASLEAMVSDYFGNIPVRVTEFMPRWAPLPTRCGSATTTMRGSAGPQFSALFFTISPASSASASARSRPRCLRAFFPRAKTTPC